MVESMGWRGHDPKNMLIIPTETIVSLSASEGFSTFVTVSGKLYIGEYSGSKGSLKEIDVGCHFVKSAALYKNQIIFVADSGLVYSFDLTTEHIQFVPILEPKKTCSHGKEEKGKRMAIAKVAAGLDHIIFQSTKQELWVQGKGPALGLFTNKTENEITYPTRVDFFKGRKVLQSTAGSYFTIALVAELPSFQKHMLEKEYQIEDFDSCVRLCEQCRKETGDRVLFEDIDDSEKCPLGIKVCKESYDKVDFSSPTGLDEQSSTISNPYEENASIGAGHDESETLSDDQSCSEAGDSKVDLEMKDNASKKENQSDISKSTYNSNVFINADTAKQFLTRPLSWVISGSLDNNQGSTENDKFNYKYPFDTATELIKENVVSAASIVATGVKTVGDKVGKLSQHFSLSVESVEDTSVNYFCATDDDLMKDYITVSFSNMRKSDSYGENTFPRYTSATHKKTHIRTGSSGLNQPANGLLYSQKNVGQVENCKERLLESGKTILSTEVWGWGSSNKGQLGLGDHSHRTMPANVITLNHSGIIKVVTGTHHTAALSIDGQVFVWGCISSQQLGPIKKSTATVPEKLILPKGTLVRDIASGKDFLIAISIDGKIFYIETQVENEAIPIREIHPADMSGTYSSVLCDYDSIIVSSGEVHPKVVAYFHMEATYLSDLKNIIHCIIQPIIHHLESQCNISNTQLDSISNKSGCSDSSNTTNNYTSALSSVPPLSKIQKTQLSLLQMYLSIAYATANSLYSLWMESTDVASLLPIVYQSEELTSLYQDYIVVVCNAMSINGLNLRSKEIEAIVEKNKFFLDSIVNLSKMKSNNDFFEYLLLLPLERIGEYEKFLLEIENDSGIFYSPFTRDKIKTAHVLWKKISLLAQNNKVEAEQTRAFWISASPKLYEDIAMPTRRVILDSRKCPINLYKAGRFSSHSFVLLSDVLVHNSSNNFVTYNLSTMWVESLNNLTGNQNIIQITLPEDTLTLVCPSPSEKGCWLAALQETIRKCVQIPGDSLLQTRSPPLVRSATYVFVKNSQYKDATYSGQWFCGKMNGEGSITWPEGRRYIGQFRLNVFQGFGRLEVVSDLGVTTYQGFWKNGKLEGKGSIRYANKDIYEGYLHESLPHGHGELKKGKFSSEAASIYTGDWQFGGKHGYGVLDDIAHGEKYHGMWQNNNRHGLGMVVTMNDVYYEGNFVNNKLAGQGLMILEDGTCYEGELGPGGSCNGKGILKYPCGDYIEGSFTGMWTDGIKVNGILQKRDWTVDEPFIPKSFGKLTVAAYQKWVSLFKQCKEHLGIHAVSPTPTSKVWEVLASFIENEKQAALRLKVSLDPLDGLEKIFDVKEQLTKELYDEIQDYLDKAFSRSLHPLGQLLCSLVSAFRATYGGVVSHPRLLQYAVEEVRSFITRIYEIVRYLFPQLPLEGECFILEDDNNPDDDIIVTATRVIQPRLLPHIYSSLSPLYVKNHQKRDEEYWQTLLKWNKQTDIALMAFLGVDMKVWLAEGKNHFIDNSTGKDHYFINSIETLQLLSTSFIPRDKLQLIHKCGLFIEEEVQEIIGKDFRLSMDEFLPLFIYVVVRSRMQHLGAEIALIYDLMDPDLQNGKLEHVFTTLQASYNFIINENSISDR